MPTTRTDVLIVGTGFAGLGMAIRLRRAGREDFLLLEKADEVGGTWRDNTYPGCTCDIPSHMYSYSYAQNPDWTRSYSAQPEIWDYLRRVTDEHRLRPRIRFGEQMLSAAWDEQAELWRVRTPRATYEARVLVSGIGGLHVPRLPDLPGRDEFTGAAFHSAQWRHDVDLRGARVAVVGTGASAIQFVPRLAETAGHTTVFQRTPAWVLPKPDHPLSPRMRTLFSRLPVAQTVYRDWLYWLLEARALGFNGHERILEVAERMVRQRIERRVGDPGTRRALTPDYRLGCKRVLLSNDFYPTFNRDDVTLVAGGVQRITPTGVVGVDGIEHPADVIVYGTGFQVTDSFRHVDIRGLGGRELWETFQRDGTETYLGIGVAGFPNLALLLGPNTALGHNSVVFMIEQQAAYVVRLLDEMDRRGVRSVDVRRPAQDAFNDEVQTRLERGVWSTGGCTSWYLDTHGRNRTIWPGFTFSYWWRTRRVEAHAYAWSASPTPQPAPIP